MKHRKPAKSCNCNRCLKTRIERLQKTKRYAAWEQGHFHKTVSAQRTANQGMKEMKILGHSAVVDKGR